MKPARILIVSAQHLCRNPRVLKEALTLGGAGYNVTVLTVASSAAFAADDRALAAGQPFRFEALDLVSSGPAPWSRGFIQRLGPWSARWWQRRTGFECAQALGPAAALRRRALMRAREAELVIVHTELPLWLAPCLRRAGHRVAVDLEDWHSEDLLPADRRHRPLRLLRAAEADALRHAAYVSTTSASLAAALVATYGGRPPLVLRNTFPLAAEARTLAPAPAAHPRLIWFSQTVGPGRGLEQFLAAFSLLQQPATLALIGSVVPGYQETLLALLPAPRRACVEFHPPVSADRLPALLAGHDVGLALEPAEPANKQLTTSNKLLQYLNAGLAVIATDTAGQREVLHAAPGCGLLIDSDQPARTAAQLDEILADPERLSAMQHAARAAAEREFCWEKDAPRLLEAVARALAGTPPGLASDEDSRRQDDGPRTDDGRRTTDDRGRRSEVRPQTTGLQDHDSPELRSPNSDLRSPLPHSAVRHSSFAIRHSSFPLPTPRSGAASAPPTSPAPSSLLPAPRLLIVSPHFPPVNTPDLQRVRMSLPHFVAAGWDVTVLTVDDPTPAAPLEPALLATVPPAVRVVRARCLSRKWTRWCGVGNVALRALPFLFLAGCRELRGGRADLVYFSTTMFAVLPFGRVWRAWFGVPYVIDLQDPWLSDHYERPGAPPPPGGWKYRFAHATARLLEGWTLRRCAHVISVSGDYLATLARRYPHFTAERGTELPFGAPEADFAVARQLSREKPPLLPASPPRRVAYAGRLGPDMLPALEVLFAATAQARETGHPVALYFFGTSYAPPERAQPTTTSLAARHGLGALVHEHPARIGYLEALRLLLETDWALVLGSTDAAYSPSKLFPAVLAGRPVLVIAPEDSELAHRAAAIAGVALVTFDPAAPPAPGPVSALTALLATPADGPPWPAGAAHPALPAAASAADGARRQLEIFDQMRRRSVAGS